jgi:hypothetical protein
MDPHTNTRFLAVWVTGPHSGNNYAEVRVGTIAADNTISYGTQYRINANTDSDAYNTKWAYAAFDSDSNNAGKFVVFWNERGEEKARVGTISGTNISFGNEYNSFISGDLHYKAPYSSITADPNNDAKFLLVYYNGSSGKAQICTLSGTSLTFGSEYTWESGAITGYSYGIGVSAAFDPNNANKFVIGYIDATSGTISNDLRTIVGTISGTSISFGSKYILENTIEMPTSLDVKFNPVGDGEFLIAYNDTVSNTPVYNTKILKSHCVGGKITGTSVAYGTPVSFKSYEQTSTLSLAFDTNYYGRFALSFASSSGYDKDVGSIIQGTMGNYDNIVFGGIFQYATDVQRSYNYPCTSITFDPNNSGKLLIGHSRDDVRAGIVTVAQLEVRDSSIRTNIKLDSATPITGGTCSNDDYTTKTTCEAASSTWTAGPAYNLSLINTESACVRAGVKQTQNTQEDCLNAHVDNEWKPHVWVETKPSVTRNEISGDVSEIEVTSNFANLPVATTSWILESVGTVEAQDFRILSIRESAPAEYEVSALKYHEAKYALIEDNIEFSAKSTSSLPDPSEAVPIPRSLDVDEELYTDSRNVIRNRATLSWLAPYTVGTSVLYPYTASYYVEWRRTDRVTNWTSLGETTSTSMVIDDAPAGEIEFRVKTKRVY